MTISLIYYSMTLNKINYTNTKRKDLLVSSVEHTLITIGVVQMSITAEDYLRHIRKEKMYVSYQYVDVNNVVLLVIGC